MTGLLESTVRKLSLVCAHDRSVRPFSRLRRSPARLAFNATEKLGPDISELLSMHCSWCVLDYGEAQSVESGKDWPPVPTACARSPPARTPTPQSRFGSSPRSRGFRRRL